MTVCGAIFSSAARRRISVRSSATTSVRWKDYNNPFANSYEQAFEVMEKLHLFPAEKDQMFRRMVFNSVVRNHDDHTRNISFLMKPDGGWQLAPAYDMAWTYKPGAKWTGQHQMPVNGKRDGFSKKDFIQLARHFDISKPDEIIQELCRTAESFGDFAQTAGVDAAVVDQMMPEFRMWPAK